MAQNQRVQISTEGLNQGIIQILDFLFSNSQDIDYAKSEVDEGDIHIIQVHSNREIVSLDAYRKNHPNNPVIAFVEERGISAENVISVKRPLSPSRLKSALYEAVEMHRSTSPQSRNNNDPGPAIQPQSKGKTSRASQVKPGVNGHRPFASDVDLNAPDAPERIFFTPDRYLMSRLKRTYENARKEKTNIQIHTKMGNFTYLHATNQVHLDLVKNNLKSLSSIPDGETAIMIDLKNNLDIDGMTRHFVRADHLLWNASVWASRGRLPHGTDLDQSFMLKCWPNFTKWAITPSAMKITVFWLKFRVSLRQTVEVLGVPQRDIFRLYSACEAVDLLDFCSDRKSSNAHIKPTKIKSLVGMMIDYMKPGSESKK